MSLSNQGYPVASRGSDARLAFLCRVVQQELKHLQGTHARLFAQPMTLEVLSKP